MFTALYNHLPCLLAAYAAAHEVYDPNTQEVRLLAAYAAAHHWSAAEPPLDPLLAAYAAAHSG